MELFTFQALDIIMFCVQVCTQYACVHAHAKSYLRVEAT
jgi:hypothetical protein